MKENKSNSSDKDSAVRAAKLAALRKSIADGTYKIPTDNIADKVIEEMIHKP
jgi:anti-sigma28 factor (negative regulator of flagellin synthesis)